MPGLARFELTVGLHHLGGIFIRHDGFRLTSRDEDLVLIVALDARPSKQPVRGMVARKLATQNPLASCLLGQHETVDKRCRN